MRRNPGWGTPQRTSARRAPLEKQLLGIGIGQGHEQMILAMSPFGLWRLPGALISGCRLPPVPSPSRLGHRRLLLYSPAGLIYTALRANLQPSGLIYTALRANRRQLHFHNVSFSTGKPVLLTPVRGEGKTHGSQIFFGLCLRNRKMIVIVRC